MTLHVYKNSFGLTYTNEKNKIGKYLGMVTAEISNESIEADNIVYANVGIFKVKVKILSTL